MRAVGRTGTVLAVGVHGSMQSKAKADTVEESSWVKLDRPRQREIFTGKSKTITFDSESDKSSKSPVRSVSNSPPLRPQVPGETIRTHSRSPHVSPSLSPAMSDSALLLQPLEKLVPRNMKLQSFLQKTWQCAETMAKNPSIRNAVQGSSEFQEFQEYMRRSISAPVNLQSSQMEQIEGGPAGPVRRVHPGSPPEHESMSEGETSPEEGDPFMILLRQLIAMPVSVIYKALSWFFPLSQLEEEGEQLKEGGEDNSMVYTTLLTACLMIILFYKKFR